VAKSKVRTKKKKIVPAIQTHSIKERRLRCITESEIIVMPEAFFVDLFPASPSLPVLMKGMVNNPQSMGGIKHLASLAVLKEANPYSKILESGNVFWDELFSCIEMRIMKIVDSADGKEFTVMIGFSLYDDFNNLSNNWEEVDKYGNTI
jgi:hypothetical protein